MTQREIRGWGLALLIFCVVVAAGLATAVFFDLEVLGLICVALFLPAMFSGIVWWSEYELYRERKPRVRRYQLERAIEDLERDLGIGLGEDWWRPDGVLTVNN